MKKQSQYYYETQPEVHLERSSFNRSSSYKTTLVDAGKLHPFFVDEVLPGDTFNHTTHIFARLATPIFPIMDNLFLETFFFFVPNRILWSNWEKFMGDKPATDVTNYQVPTMTTNSTGNMTLTSLYDYMGLPIAISGIEVNVLPLRAYNLIYNRWFYEQNLSLPATINTGDSGDAFDQYLLRYRMKKRDYFTACLPWPQKGDAVEIPISLSTQAFVTANTAANPYVSVKNSSGTAKGLDDDGTAVALLAGAAPVGAVALYADMTNALAPGTINDLREAFQLQKLLERDARGGTRYIEQLYSHFGVVNPDFRLAEPELLTVHRQPININPVAQTSSTDATSPQGNLAAFGTSSGSSHYIKSFTEHGFIIGLVNVRAELSYYQGLDKMWSRGASKYDYYWPALAHLGEQAVLNKELYAQGTSADEDVFGYIPRYDEYRYKKSLVTNLFRPNVSGSYKEWILTQDFTSLPTLNETFLSDVATGQALNRVMAVAEAEQVLLDVYHNLNCVRVMPTYAIPGYVDHF